MKDDLPIVNFEVMEIWFMECPFCYKDQDAPFNEGSPMEPMKVICEKCDKEFILTYERDN